MHDDIPLREAQVLWDYHGKEPDAPAVLVMGHPDEHGRDRWGNRNDPNYFASWGACMQDFCEASDERKLLMLFRQFHWMVLSKEVAPQAVHDAFLRIPEYRAEMPLDFLPDDYRSSDGRRL